jgi:hypothetical protein
MQKKRMKRKNVPITEGFLAFQWWLSFLLGVVGTNLLPLIFSERTRFNELTRMG